MLIQIYNKIMKKTLFFLTIGLFAINVFSQTLLTFENFNDGKIYIKVKNETIYSTSIDTSQVSPEYINFANMLADYIPGGETIQRYMYQDSTISWTVRRVLVWYDDGDPVRVGVYSKGTENAVLDSNDRIIWKSFYDKLKTEL